MFARRLALNLLKDILSSPPDNTIWRSDCAAFAAEAAVIFAHFTEMSRGNSRFADRV